ncbi:hypothetical protein BRADI_1g27024v3 [Brachypodium distachyon]|uniref:HAT C-terminal dimerisation domain-containing protein n=1 Tax=Brachypodium distachyon TaxID=15368 RepID=A0A2K2DLA1_BRADI|nr:hypothetical protein BRADI_1g27024v3 [Brachypodium distachyon]
MSSRIRKYDSGYEKRKKKKRLEAVAQTQKGALDRFVVKDSQFTSENQTPDPDDNVDDAVEVEAHNTEIDHGADDANQPDANNVDQVGDQGHDDRVDASLDRSPSTENHNDNNNTFQLDIFDPRNWDALDSKMVDILVQKGPRRDLPIQKGPKDGLSRRFSASTYTRVLSNGEKCDRNGLLQSNQTIDKVAQRELQKERDHWRKVLFRIILIVKFLAEHTLAFRGTNSKLYQDSNGNFLGIIQMLAEFDPVIQEHVKRITNDEFHIHYLGHGIQNEIISLLAFAIRSEIIKKKWQILKDNIIGLPLKSLSSTRWESRVDSVKAIRFQIQEIREALLEVAENDKDPKTSSEAMSLANNELGDFEFLVAVVIWYKILSAINLVSKQLQAKDMLIDIAIEEVQRLISFFSKYREIGFSYALEAAKEIALENNIVPEFRTKRKIKRKRQFDESPDDASIASQQSAHESFRVNYFIPVVDQAIDSLTRRFEQYQGFENIFGFLFTSDKLCSLDDKSLLSSSNIHKYLKRRGCFPNAVIAYRILLTIPVTVASAKRSFSKLKLLKSYLRSTMTQERFNGLATISLENDVLEKINYEDIIEDFVSRNTRRMMLFTRS